MERKKALMKYIPDVCRALTDVLNKMSGISEEKAEGKESKRSDDTKIRCVAIGPNPKRKDLQEKINPDLLKTGIEIVNGVANGDLTSEHLQKN